MTIVVAMVGMGMRQTVEPIANGDVDIATNIDHHYDSNSGDGNENNNDVNVDVNDNNNDNNDNNDADAPSTSLRCVFWTLMIITFSLGSIVTGTLGFVCLDNSVPDSSDEDTKKYYASVEPTIRLCPSYAISLFMIIISTTFITSILIAWTIHTVIIIKRMEITAAIELQRGVDRITIGSAAA